MEEWRPVVGFEDSYEVSDLGNIRSFRNQRNLKAKRRPDGYGMQVGLTNRGMRADVTVHRTVVRAFMGSEYDTKHFTWLDGDVTNNCLANLALRTNICGGCGEHRDDVKGGRCSQCRPIQRRQAHDRAEDRRRASEPDCCDICGNPETATRNGRVRRLNIDHNHETGQIRGQLCSRCNLGIGLFADDPDILTLAAEYLDSWAAEAVA